MVTTATKTSERDMLTWYQTPIEQTAPMKRVLDKLAEAAKREQDITARAQRAVDARKHGSHIELLEALRDAPSVDDVARATAEVAVAREAVATTRASVKAEVEEHFRAYARPQVERLIRDLRGVLEHNRAFETICALRTDAVSGTGFGGPVLDNPALPLLRGHVEQFAQFWSAELDLDL